MLKRQAALAPDPRLSYRVHWAGVVQRWDAEQRRRVLAALRARTASGGFEPTEWERRYVVQELDDQAHAGASLLCLIDVLQSRSWDQQQAVQGDSKPPA